MSLLLIIIAKNNHLCNVYGSYRKQVKVNSLPMAQNRLLGYVNVNRSKEIWQRRWQQNKCIYCMLTYRNSCEQVCIELTSLYRPHRCRVASPCLSLVYQYWACGNKNKAGQMSTATSDQHNAIFDISTFLTNTFK